MVTNGHEAGSMRGGGRSGRLASAAALVGVLLVGFVTGTPPAWAQWAVNGADISYTGGNVGIGTTNPTSLGGFAPITEIQGVYPAVSLSKTTGTNRVWTMGLNTGGVLQFYDETAGVIRMTLDTSGNVGIGTLDPAAILHVAGDARVDGNIAAKYQDVAEWVNATAELPQGTVVIIAPHESNRVAAASQPYDTRVAGVVSTRPGVLLGEGGEGKAKVAHSGRVKVKADAGYGPIAVGDLLVTSSTLGYAMRSAPVEMGGIQLHRPGTLIGKALEPLENGKGEILVLLTLQ